MTMAGVPGGNLVGRLGLELDPPHQADVLALIDAEYWIPLRDFSKVMLRAVNGRLYEHAMR